MMTKQHLLLAELSDARAACQISHIADMRGTDTARSSRDAVQAVTSYKTNLAVLEVEEEDVATVERSQV